MAKKPNKGTKRNPWKPGDHVCSASEVTMHWFYGHGLDDATMRACHRWVLDNGEYGPMDPSWRTPEEIEAEITESREGCEESYVWMHDAKRWGLTPESGYNSWDEIEGGWKGHSRFWVPCSPDSPGATPMTCLDFEARHYRWTVNGIQ